MNKAKQQPTTTDHATTTDHGKINAYVCGNLHVTVTEDRDVGTTPMFIQCPKCGMPTTAEQELLSMGRSLMYKVNQKEEATHEWYKPTEDEMADLCNDMSEGAFRQIAEHVKQGGLLFREKVGVKRLKELKEWWSRNQMCIVDDDYEEDAQRIRKEVMELHRETPGLLKKEDLEYFRIIVKEGGENE